jgi:hypothetical protein
MGPCVWVCFEETSKQLAGYRIMWRRSASASSRFATRLVCAAARFDMQLNVVAWYQVSQIYILSYGCKAHEFQTVFVLPTSQTLTRPMPALTSKR